MTNGRQTEPTCTRRLALALAALSAAAALTACSHAMMMREGAGRARPGAVDFGLGPRTSAAGLYVATLEPAPALRPRRLLTLRVTIRTAAGRPVLDARIAIGGGMPRHGHGLPTRPRATSLGDGLYELEGVRFNMGGWWELTLTVAGPDGDDTVVFNLDV
ncbi:MAG: FixH family protein [Vicinamibacterales bacterium]